MAHEILIEGIQGLGCIDEPRMLTLELYLKSSTDTINVNEV